MLSKGLLLCVACFFFSTLLPGQIVSVSEKFSLRNDDGFQLLGKVGEQFFVLRDRVDTYNLLAYDKDLKESFDKEIDLGSKKARVLAIATDKEFITLIYRYPKRSDVHLCAMKFDTQANLVDSTTIKVFDTRGFISINLDMAASKNEDYILLYDNDLFEKFYGIAFHLKEMKVVWQKSFFPGGVDLEEDFHTPLIDNKSNLHLIYDKDNKRQKREETRFEVLFYDAAADSSAQYTIPTMKRLWNDVHFSYDDLNDRLLAAGLYADKRVEEANGLFYLKINPSVPEAFAIKFESFDERFMTSVLGKEIKREGGLDEVEIQEVVLRRDGGVLLIVERVREYSHSSPVYSNYSNERLTDFQIDYHFNDLLLFSIHPSGSLHWKEILRKRQYSQNDNGDFSSYFLLKTRSNLRFLYNDEINLDTNVNEYVVQGNGKNERNSILHTKEENLSLMFRDALQIDANSLVVPSLRKGELKLVVIQF